mmetsp:Transcript_10516/g.17189  ORF Transcript_10516/g.17189 Transcript_10516/m.17189 type:complete len:109 (-) Transcript_10516:657-983(-)
MAEDQGFDDVKVTERSLIDEIKKRPFVPLCAIGTAVVLIRGAVKSMKSGDSRTAARAMSYRVLAQGATLCVLVAAVGGTELYNKYIKEKAPTQEEQLAQRMRQLGEPR